MLDGCKSVASVVARGFAAIPAHFLQVASFGLVFSRNRGEFRGEVPIGAVACEAQAQRAASRRKYSDVITGCAPVVAMRRLCHCIAR